MDPIDTGKKMSIVKEVLGDAKIYSKAGIIYQIKIRFDIYSRIRLLVGDKLTLMVPGYHKKPIWYNSTDKTYVYGDLLCDVITTDKNVVVHRFYDHPLATFDLERSNPQVWSSIQPKRCFAIDIDGYYQSVHYSKAIEVLKICRIKGYVIRQIMDWKITPDIVRATVRSGYCYYYTSGNQIISHDQIRAVELFHNGVSTSNYTEISIENSRPYAIGFAYCGVFYVINDDCIADYVGRERYFTYTTVVGLKFRYTTNYRTGAIIIVGVEYP